VTDLSKSRDSRISANYVGNFTLFDVYWERCQFCIILEGRKVSRLGYCSLCPRASVAH